MRMRDDKYWPRDIAEVAQKVSLINEALTSPDGTVALPVVQREKPLHALLCESLVHTKELLNRWRRGASMCPGMRSGRLLDC
jgi:hypothetical protein